MTVALSLSPLPAHYLCKAATASDGCAKRNVRATGEAQDLGDRRHRPGRHRSDPLRNDGFFYALLPKMLTTNSR